MSGIDQNLAANAEAYRRAKESPVDEAEIRRYVQAASREFDLLSKGAADVLTKANFERVYFYSKLGRFSAPDFRGAGWDLQYFWLTEAGQAYCKLHPDQPEIDANRRARHRLRHLIPQGRPLYRIDQQMPIGPPRELFSDRKHFPTLTATTRGKVDIFHDTHENQHMFFDVWLNEKLRWMLK